MKTILVPVDFSSNSLNALKYACAYAEQTNSRLIVFNAYPIPSADVAIPFTGIYNFQDEPMKQARKQMDKLIADCESSYPLVKVKGILQGGDPSTAILDIIKARKIRMVIMGTTGKGKVSSFIFGSTVSYVIKHAPCNVLAIPPRIRFTGMKKLAVATDLKKDTLSTTREVIGLARHFDSEVMFVHVQDKEFFDSKDKYPEMAAIIKKHTAYKKISFHIPRNPGLEEGLKDFTRKNKPDLLVMPSHKHNYLASLWHTSQTKKMAGTTKVPLLSVNIHNK